MLSWEREGGKRSDQPGGRNLVIQDLPHNKKTEGEKSSLIFATCERKKKRGKEERTFYR